MFASEVAYLHPAQRTLLRRYLQGSYFEPLIADVY